MGWGGGCGFLERGRCGKKMIYESFFEGYGKFGILEWSNVQKWARRLTFGDTCCVIQIRRPVIL